MKKYLIVALPLSISMFIAACGGKADEAKEEEKPDNPLEALEEYAEESQQAQSDAEKKIAERKAKGDTLAMPYEDLMKYLPEKIDGYTKGEPDGASINIPGSSYSTANADYTNDKGERVKVTIVDYNQAYAMYSGLTAMWAFSVDTPEEKSQGVKIDDKIAGWEQFRKKSGDAVITLGVGYRFWVQVEADNQKDTEWVKSVAKSIDLDKLAAM
jgi:TPR repeat protein